VVSVWGRKEKEKAVDSTGKSTSCCTRRGKASNFLAAPPAYHSLELFSSPHVLTIATQSHLKPPSHREEELEALNGKNTIIVAT
jgi:hypothetical protein